MIRIRRLRREFEKILEELSGNKYVTVEPLQGDPPWCYRVTYSLDGLVWDEASQQPKRVGRHVVEIVLPTGYPKQPPKCTMITPAWHPNIGEYICIGDFWSPGVTLVDIVVHIADMIQYRSYNFNSPVNKEAAAWARRNMSSFPAGTQDILTGSGDSGRVQIEIGSAKPRDCAGDVDIVLGPVRDRNREC